MDKQHTVLLVEDDEGLRYAMSAALRKQGFVVNEAAEGKEAVAKIRSDGQNFCCVVLDMIVPNIHGSSILSHIAREIPKLAVVAVTGYPDRVLFSDQSDRHVVKAIFVKPVDPVDVATYLWSRCSREDR